MNNKSNFFVVYPRLNQSATDKIMHDISFQLGFDYNLWSYAEVQDEEQYYTDVVAPAIEEADFVLIFIGYNSEKNYDYIVAKSASLCRNMNKSVLPVKYGSYEVDEKYWNFRAKMLNIYDEQQKDALIGQMRSWLGMIVVDNRACIDLGLPSGILWANCNVGSKSPNGKGFYYAWSESPSSEYSYNENMVVAPKYSDPAIANWGAGWRMPTKMEFDELLSNCRWQWTGRGYKVTGPSGNFIFLPALGYCVSSFPSEEYVQGYYWTKTPLSETSRQRHFLYIDSKSNAVSCDNCHFGMQIRAVYSPTKTSDHSVRHGRDNYEGAYELPRAKWALFFALASVLLVFFGFAVRSVFLWILCVLAAILGLTGARSANVQYEEAPEKYSGKSKIIVSIVISIITLTIGVIGFFSLL